MRHWESRWGRPDVTASDGPVDCGTRQTNRRLRRPTTSNHLAAAVVLLSIPSTILGQDGRRRSNELALGFGLWIAGELVTRSAQFDDPTVGPVEFGTSASQENAPSISATYTRFLNDWFGLGASVAYASPDWSFRIGSVEDGEVVGMTVVHDNINTLGLSANGVLRLPTAPNLPSPFISVGIGGASYEVERLRGSLTFTPTVGTPVDTVLFELDLGITFAPDIAAGVYYALAPRVALRADARLGLLLTNELVHDETIVLRTVRLNLSGGYVF